MLYGFLVITANFPQPSSSSQERHAKFDTIRFTNPTWRKRTLLAFLVVFAIQSAGINVITTYLILEAELVGLTGSMPLLIYAVYVVIAISMNFVNAYLLDIIGRKILLGESHIIELVQNIALRTDSPYSHGLDLDRHMSLRVDPP